MAVVEPAGDGLGEALDLGLLGAARRSCARGGIVVVIVVDVVVFVRLIVPEYRQDVLLVQALERLRLARDVAQELRHLVPYVGPPRRQHVHLDHRVAVVVVQVVVEVVRMR